MAATLKPDRRIVVGGLACLAVSAARARAEDAAPPVSPVAHGVLANNALAQAFESAPASLPDVMIYGPNGARHISTLMGRTLILPLWAEWCAPCLEEIPDFGRLQQRYGNDKFAIVPILSGTHRAISPQNIADIFKFLHADVFEPLMEDNRGALLALALASPSPHKIELPCNVLIAPDGSVVAREFGIKQNEEDEAAAKAAGGGGAMVARAQAGDSLSLWGKPEGEQLAQALANGFLAS